MSEQDKDKRLSAFLTSNAPPAQDPLFRIKVLERREQRQFQRRALIMLAGALVILLACMFALGMGQGAFKTTGAVVIFATLVTAWLAFRGRLLQTLRLFSL